MGNAVGGRWASWLVLAWAGACGGGDATPGADTLADTLADTETETEPEITDATVTSPEATSETLDDDADAMGDPPDVFIAEGHPRILLDGATRARLGQLLASSHPAAERFVALVDARVYDDADVYAFSAADAALLYQLTGTAAYADAAIAQIDDEVRAEEALIARGERAEVAYDSYLYVGARIGDLALVYDWCFDRLSRDQRERWLRYADHAVWNVWHPDQASWGGVTHPWSGWSIDNPSNNYFYSFLRATMLLGLAARGELATADEWIALARDDRLERLLFPTFERDLTGGGSREGTGYGTAMRELFSLYHLWQTTTGERIADRTAHTRASLAYLMHATVPTLDFLAPIGDHARDSTAALFDYHRQYLLALRLLERDSPLAAIATSYLADCSVPEMQNGFQRVHDFVYADDGIPVRPLSDLHTTYHAPGVGHVFWRSGWMRDATWVGFIAGPYTESHAHRDQGSFLLYGGEWLAYDQNYNSHSGIVQDEIAHNLVTLEGADGEPLRQREGTTSTLLALRERPGILYLAADLTPAYDGAAGLDRIQRELVVIAPGVVVVVDRVDVAPDVRATWHLQAARAPVLDGGTATIAGPRATLRVRPVLPSPADADLAIVSWRDADGDMNDGYRIDLAGAAGATRMLVVLDRDGAVTSTSRDGELGVTLALADGRDARLSFDVASPGVAIEIDDGAGGTLLSEHLGPGSDPARGDDDLDALPLYRDGVAR